MGDTVTRRADAPLTTPYGTFRIVGYESDDGETQHVALVFGTVSGEHGVLTRVHSECLTGDVFGSLRCDCRQQLEMAMQRIADEGSGVVVYLRGHEGRGIGLMAKLRAYALQADEGLDTVEANERLGFEADVRTYADAAVVLADLGVRSVRLLTNNPAKRDGLVVHGVVVDESVPIQAPNTPENRAYLATKADRMGHRLER